MEKSHKDSTGNRKTADEIARGEIDRINARLRHFRGIAAGVIHDASKILNEIWDSCHDPRSWQEILDGVPEPVARTPVGGWAEFFERLHLLGTYLDYAKKLCEGSIDQQIQHEREVELCPANSKSSPAVNNLSPPKFCRQKKT